MSEGLSVHNTLLRVNGSLTWISYTVATEPTEENIVILIIPGNPGPIGFYDVFISTIFKESGGKLTIYGISHAGHHSSDPDVFMEEGSRFSYKDARFARYSLQEQVTHKIAFINSYIEPDAKLILIGHSIGAYITLEIMKRLDYSNKIIKGILLFPAIERITKTPSGQFWIPVSNYLKWPLLGLVTIFSSLPIYVQRKCVDACGALRRFSSTDNITTSILAFLNYTGIQNMFQIAHDMALINDLDHEEVIVKNAAKLTFYYGTSDPWAPLSFYEAMRDRFPAADIKLCPKHFKHAFVLYSAEDMGKQVWSWICESVSTSGLENNDGRSSRSAVNSLILVEVTDAIENGKRGIQVL